MHTRSRAIRSLAAARSTSLDLCLLAGGVTLTLLQAFRVFIPYLVVEVDQSERERLARIAFTVFGLTFVGALLFRLFRVRATVVIAVATMAISRLGFQFTSEPDARWRLAAAAIVASLWLLIVVLPKGGRSVGIGIGFAFLIDLLLRSIRGTLDLPWMPGLREDVLTIAIIAAVAIPANALLRSDALSPVEMSFGSSTRYIGIGSGIALWLVVAGIPGFAVLRSGLDRPGAFALLAAGVLLALVVEILRPFRRASERDELLIALGLGSLGAIAVLTWWGEWNRWLDLIAVPLFSFAVVTLTMRCATAPGVLDVSGRWRTGAALTVGVLLQAAFIFLYFARTGPMELYLAPLAILTVAAAIATRTSTNALPERHPLLRVAAVAAVAAVLIFVWLRLEESSHSTSIPRATDLTVMTFNIQEGFSNENIWSLEQSARAIEAHDPDIVVLQEITRGWLVMSSVDQVRWLADRLDMEYAYAGNSHDGLWGIAILSRLPIVSTDTFSFSTTDNLRRGALAIEVETVSGPLLVIDTHLDNPIRATNVRLQQIAELIEFWGGSTPAIIAGDFNADPGSQEWQAMIDAGFVDAGEGTSETTSEDERRIDYIFVTPDLNVDGYTVSDAWVSDHHPVLIEISLSP